MIVVSRKGGSSEEKFFLPPCKSVQLRGIRKLQEFAEQELNLSLEQLVAVPTSGTASPGSPLSSSVTTCVSSAAQSDDQDLELSVPRVTRGGRVFGEERVEKEVRVQREVEAMQAEKGAAVKEKGLSHSPTVTVGGRVGGRKIRLPPKSSLVKANV